MSSLRHLVFGLAAVLFLGAATPAPADLDNTVYFDLPAGRVTVQLHPEWAPKTVARFKELVHKNWYDNSAFWRVIPGFIAQTGARWPNGQGETGKLLGLEASDAKHIRGRLSMAHQDGKPNSNDCQFVFILAPAPHLDGQYTVFGEVVSGMEFVDKIKTGDVNKGGLVKDPDEIQKAVMAADAPAK